MLRASIDLGTNTCLLLIAEVDSSGVNTRQDFSTVVRLGQGVDQGRVLNPEAIERTLRCLKNYAEKVKAAGLKVSETVAVATSQARDAKNGADFFARVEKECGFRFQIITGDQEAELTFLGGLLPASNPARSAVIDIGGGSTEIISLQGGQSLDIGSVRFTERFLKSDPVTDPEFWACQEAIDLELTKLTSWRDQNEGLTLTAVAGTATTLAAYHLGLAQFNAQEIDGTVLTRGDLHRMVEDLKWRTIAERKALPGIEEGRADVLLAGALILWRAHELLRFPECRVSTRGLRYGVLQKL